MTFMKEFNEKADILVEFLKKKADGKTEIILLDQFNHTALDIIASVSPHCYFKIINIAKLCDFRLLSI